MMTYNLDFLIAGLVLLLIVFYHYKEHDNKQQRLDSTNNRIFRFFIATALADVSFDLLSSVLIMDESPELANLTNLVLILFYILQVIYPVALVFYAQTLREVSFDKIKKEMLIWLVLPTLILFLVLSNSWTGLLFSVDAGGVYHHGPLYLLMYGYAFVYAWVLVFLTLIHKKELSGRNVAVLWEFLLIECCCVIYQALHSNCLTTGFGISIGVTVLYLTIGNPSSYTDHMTGAFDKNYFDTWFHEQSLKGKPVHIITITLPRLQHINRVFGSNVGNQLLRQITETLQQIDPHVQVFRVSGKKFFLVMQTLADYERTRDEALAFFRKTFDTDGGPVVFPAIICGIIHGERLPENSFVAYTDYMAGLVQNTRETVLIQSDDKMMNGFLYERKIDIFLREAIEKDLFDVYFQPIYSLEKGGYVTLEALSRLWHPTLGYVPPDVFITLAEKNGQILKIGLLQFRRVCRFVKENQWIMEEIRNVKFNLSPVELLEYDHVEALLDVIREFGLKPSYFQFEITETAATEYSAPLYEALDLIQKAGVTLCLDDFGSGYANLDMILKLPFACIKIDRSLLRGLNEEPQVAFFYHSLVSVLNEMRYRVVAEGVETEEEKETLAQWGVDMIQGFYFSKPLSSPEIVELLKAQSAGEACS